MDMDNAYLTVAAHDLRAPLQSVKGLVYLMKQEPDRENLDPYFTMLDTSVDRMNQSISDMLHHSTNVSNGVRVEEMTLRSVIEEATCSLRFLPGAEHVRIDVSTGEEELFYSDRHCLFSVLTNIISNAIRYRDVHKESFVNIAVTHNHDGAEVIIADNGIGIAEGVQEKIFEKFYRVNNTPGGSGLGLYMVKHLMEKLGGTLQLLSVLGEGTTFRLQIPNLPQR